MEILTAKKEDLSSSFEFRVGSSTSFERNNALVHKEDERKLNNDARKMLFQASNVEELPKDMKKLCKSSRLTDEVMNQNFQIILNILHFVTHKVYTQQPDNHKQLENVSPQKLEQSTSLNQASTVIIAQNPKDKYKKLRKNGKGGFGVVYIGKDVAHDNKKVAVKRVKHDNQRSKLDNLNECRFLKMCDHPNIVSFRSAYEYKDECWIIMEFLEGGTLTEAKRGHDFAEKEIAFVARELLRGIEHIHSHKLVHRDVKSENIMLSIMGDVKLIDFGLCIDEASIKRPSMVGSPYWMPPEMIARKLHSYPADIWSFGVSILELANRNPPNCDNKIRAMFNVGTHGIPHPLEEPYRWSDDFKDFISKCLEFDPKKRATAKELLEHSFIKQASNTRKVMRQILSELFFQRAIGMV